ncbi:rhomboid family intramembrane serine protease [Beijerinckia sp. L45]|uniref:rhomboid family intramembrane serine protease n=1 Tax=Beijerinckia sp. L45 TaxID=1641855 RepID=UPI00131B8A00|nr:rhomboid family intramembrane serine protease [Beijerinckia sp. L45]
MTLDTPRRERIFNIPTVVVVICALLFLIQGLGDLIAPETYGRLLIRFAFVPGRFTFAFDPDRVSAAFNQIAKGDELRAQIAAAFLGDGTAQWWTVLTYAFLHGSWMHVGVNCLWLVAFGGAVAKRLSTLRFLALLAVCSVAGAFVHYLTHVADLEPVVGASAAVSGAMGAATRFMFQTGAPLGTGFGRRGSVDRDDVMRLPALSLFQTLTDRRTLTFIAIWFLSNLIFGVSGAMPGLGDATVAWEAHVGGFLAGLLLFGWFDPAPKLARPDHDIVADGPEPTIAPSEGAEF